MLTHHLNLLKKRVLDIANLPNFTSADCKTLSAIIFQKTKKRLSETTLKRVYGFVQSQFQSSQFTIDTLADYCGYKDWATFLSEHTTQLPSGKTADWLKLSNDTLRITNLTLRAAQKRCGIPYNKTIKRAFIDELLEDFIASDQIATALVAPTGYGKTVALLHWVEERITFNAEHNINDIILFFSSSSLMSVLSSGQDIHSWLLSILGYNRVEILNMLLNDKKKAPGKFFLIVDGFDEHPFSSDQFQLICDQIIDIFSLYESAPAFKMIFTMRSDTWINNRHIWRGDEQQWFMGFKTNYDAFGNVPLFSYNELNELAQGINPLTSVNISPEIMNLLNHPLYFQAYYKLNKNNFSLNNVNGLYRYEIISSLILDHVYLDKYSSEKMLFFFGLIDLMCLKNGIYRVNKIKADALFEKYHNIYQNLLGTEFLTEYNESIDLLHNTYIEFGNKDFLEYTIAQKLLTYNENQFDLKLIDTAEALLNNDLKLNVIKWLIIYAIKTNANYDLNYLASVSLPLNKKADLINFIGEILDSSTLKTPEKQPGRLHWDDDLFSYFFGLEYISPQYEKTLQTLLKFELSNEKQILTRCCLAMISILKMDLKGVDNQLTHLRKIPQIDFYQYPIDPLNCLDTIYHYLKYSIVKKEALAEITRFCFNPLVQLSGLEQSITNDIIYILAARTLQIAGNPRKTIRFIEVLNKHYQDLSASASCYTFFLKNILADNYFMLNNKDRLFDTYMSVIKLGNYYDGTHTPYVSIFYHALNIKVALLKGDCNAVGAEYKCFVMLADKHDLKFEKFYLISLMLKRSHGCTEDELPQLYKQLHYEHTKFTIQLGGTELLERLAS